jgi:hypothetical protein
MKYPQSIGAFHGSGEGPEYSIPGILTTGLPVAGTGECAAFGETGGQQCTFIDYR